MESPGSSHGRFRTRSRSRRRKASSVSARLQPDFDPRESLRNALDTSQNPVNVKPRDSDEELDPKTMDFATLVECLHPTFILDYLQKILQFLRTDSSELCFPNIAPYKETFLVKIANDNQRLKCPVFDEHCRELGRQILKVIDDNRNVYRWIHMYESGRVTKNVLVYKKMFYNEKKSSAMGATASEFKMPGPLPTWSKTLASQLENLDLSKDPKPRKDPDIPTSLKITILNSTIQFLNEDNRRSLEYPEMSAEQAKYFDSIISRVDGQTNVGFFTTLYTPLYKALDNLRGKYDLKTVISDRLNDNVRMTLRKIPKESPNDMRQVLKSRPPDPPRPPDRQANSQMPLTKAQKEFQIRQKVVHACSPAFIVSSLRRILDFLDDEQTASVQFDEISLDESSFLQMVFTLSRHPEYYDLFTDECVILLKKIYRVERYQTQQRRRWKINTIVGRLQKFTRRGMLSFEKVPTGGKRENNSTNILLESLDRVRDSRSTTATDSSRSRDVSHERSVPDIAQRLLELSTRCDVTASSQDNSSTERLGLGSTTEHNRSISNDRSASDRSDSRTRRDRHRDRKHSKERRQTTSKYGIVFQSAGEQVIDSTTVTTVTGDTCHGQEGGRPARHFGRKQKLMDDLATPIESDKAKRMMLGMGWQGGPLGARGDGITEPIMPAIHLAPGAGLGHVKKDGGGRSVAEFRELWLRTYIAFITGPNEETSLPLALPLSKREIRFVRTSVQLLNQRRRIGVKLEHTDYVQRILEEMVSRPRLLVDCDVDRAREIRFVKTEGTLPQSSGKKRKKRSATTVSATAHTPTTAQTPTTSHTPTNLALLANCKDADIITTEGLLNTDLSVDNCSQKAYKNIACKVTFLEKINEFLQSPDEKKEYVCDFILNNKQRDYIHLVVTMVNKRDLRYKFGTRDENEVYNAIQMNVNNCFMTVIFSGQKFVLHKRFYQKRFTNSSIVPPVSKDETKTIVYENNAVKRGKEQSTDKCQSDRNTEHTDTKKTNRHDITDKDEDEKEITEKDEDEKERNNDDTSCDVNDDSDFITFSDKDDVLILNADDTDLEDLDTDSQSDKSEKDSDEYKDWESDCNDINDLATSDESMLIDMLEKENNSCLFGLNDNSNGIGENEDSKVVSKDDDDRLTPERKTPPRNVELRNLNVNNECDSKAKKDAHIIKETKTIAYKAQNDKDRIVKEKTPLVDDMMDDEISLTPPLVDFKLTNVICSKHGVDNSNEQQHTYKQITDQIDTDEDNNEKCTHTDIDDIKLHQNKESINIDSDLKVDEINCVVTGMSIADFVRQNNTKKDTQYGLNTHTSATENSEEAVHNLREKLNVEDLYENLEPPVHDSDKLSAVELTEIKTDFVSSVAKSPKVVELLKEDTSLDSSYKSEMHDNSEEFLTPRGSLEKFSEDEDVYETSDLNETTNTIKDMDETIEAEFSVQNDVQEHVNLENVKDTEETIGPSVSLLDNGKKQSDVVVIDYKTVDGEKSPTYRFYDNLEGYISELSIKKDVKKDNNTVMTECTETKTDNFNDANAVDLGNGASLTSVTMTNDVELVEVNNNGSENNDSKLLVATENQSVDKNDLKSRQVSEKPSNLDQNTIRCGGENLVLKRAISKDSLHIESSSSSSKRSRSDSENSDKLPKRYKHETPRRVNITCTGEEISAETVKFIQKSLSEAIDESLLLPLLECNGIQNGRLVYTCYNDQTLIWLKKVLKNNDFSVSLKVVDAEFIEEKNFILKVKLNSFIAEDNEKILGRIELFNTGLSISAWEVIDRKVTDGYIILVVKVDDESYQYISENNFSLFAGVTKAQFSAVWE